MYDKDTLLLCEGNGRRDLQMIRVVVADDEPYFQLFMEKVVDWEHMGFEIVGMAKNGEETLELVHTLRPAVLFLDINMPYMTGIQMTEKLREENSDLMVVFVTGYSEFEYARRAIQLGVEEYLLKPFSPEELMAVLQKIKLKIKKMEEEPKQQDKEKILVREWIWIQFLTGNEKKKDELIEKLMQGGVCRSSEYFRIAVIDAVDVYKYRTQPEEIALMEFSIENILRECVQIKGTHEVIHLSGNQMVSVLNYEDENVPEGEWKAGYENLCARMKEYFRFTVRVGISGMIKGFAKVPEAYRNAKAVLQSCFLQTECQVLCADDGEKQNVQAGFYRVELNDRLLLALRKGRSKEVAGILEEIRKNMLESRISADLARTMLLGILAIGLSYVTERGGNLEEIYGENFAPYQAIDAADSMDGCFFFLGEIFDKAVEFGKSHTTRRSDEILCKILDLIHSEYGNPDLSVKGIAQTVYLDASYIRRIFAKEMGTTISDYLTEVRMKEAGRMMKEEGQSVGEVAQKVGYIDAGYFSKCFKKFYGMSPSIYLGEG